MAANEPGAAQALAPLDRPIPGPAPAASAASGQYEFSYSENAVIRSLGSKMSFVGLFMLGIGLFFFVSVIVRWIEIHELEVALLFLSLLFIVVGIWTHRAGREFRSVAETQGKDISHLMGARQPAQALHPALPDLLCRPGLRDHPARGAQPVRPGRTARRTGSIPGVEGRAWPVSTS